MEKLMRMTGRRSNETLLKSQGSSDSKNNDQMISFQDFINMENNKFADDAKKPWQQRWTDIFDSNQSPAESLIMKANYRQSVDAL